MKTSIQVLRQSSSLQGGGPWSRMNCASKASAAMLSEDDHPRSRRFFAEFPQTTLNAFRGHTTVDNTNPAPPSLHYTTTISGVSVFSESKILPIKPLYGTTSP